MYIGVIYYQLSDAQPIIDSSNMVRIQATRGKLSHSYIYNNLNW